MLYPIFKFLNEHYDMPGAGMFQYISFRSAVAVILALLITIFFGRTIIRALQRHQIGEEIRDLGLEGQLSKKGTPTMGGVIILLAILVPMLLVGRLDNIYVILMLISTLWLGLLGFLDDYIKTFRHNKDGLKGKFKIVGQVGLGVIVGTVMCFSQDVVIREKVSSPTAVYVSETGYAQVEQGEPMLSPTPQKTTKTTIPFVKDNEFDYGWLVGGNKLLTWLLYIAVAIFVVTAVSNGANLTDGLDGLLTTVSVPIMLVLGALAYLSGHIIYADYLNIMYIPESAELVVFAAAMCGALLGFLWWNSFPAQIFMGDTGSLSIGGIIAVFALCIRKELLLPLMCGIFLAEALSVMVQVGWFKYTKRKYGEGRRVLLMSPLHHHYQKKGIFETKIVMRFFIISILLCALSLVTLKIR
ncbi:MAG: phospho-N-acetylmuramoyl-pentapeptide-transferase [Alistipes sp.]|nr:phospho-N-acetylmuramoyl-pentapeptide-transferase [Alistipes sp.]MBO5983978.1 phospho-N-acetylmuramoyl-pentapeptide-transferase [Rikenellaceae bacterium]MBO7343118.1 phospho-N-acetylmuramoyl-pentapeptide-transferase [Alistipes sp.]